MKIVPDYRGGEVLGYQEHTILFTSSFLMIMLCSLQRFLPDMKTRKQRVCQKCVGRMLDQERGEEWVNK